LKSGFSGKVSALLRLSASLFPTLPDLLRCMSIFGKMKTSMKTD
jgi:hypothetical protein